MMFDEPTNTSGREILRQSLFFVIPKFGFCRSTVGKKLLTGRCRSSPLIYASKKHQKSYRHKNYLRVCSLTDKTEAHMSADCEIQVMIYDSKETRHKAEQISNYS